MVVSRFKLAFFNHMKVGGDADFREAEFEAGGRMFVRNFVGDLKPGKARAPLREAQLAAQFTGMKVAGDAIFSSTVFDGVVFFARIDVGGDFRGDWTLKGAFPLALGGESFEGFRFDVFIARDHTHLLGIGCGVTAWNF